MDGGQPTTAFRSDGQRISRNGVRGKNILGSDILEEVQLRVGDKMHIFSYLEEALKLLMKSEEED